MTRTFALSALLLFALPALPADLSQWENLQNLRPGDRIGLVQADRTRIEGRFTSVSGDSITLDRDASVTVPKDRVVRAYRRPRLNRTARILIGGAIGVGIGGILSATVGQYYRNETGGVAAGAFIGGGAALGLGVGALSGGGERTIYEKPAHP